MQSDMHGIEGIHFLSSCIPGESKPCFTVLATGMLMKDLYQRVCVCSGIPLILDRLVDFWLQFTQI